MYSVTRKLLERESYNRVFSNFLTTKTFQQQHICIFGEATYRQYSRDVQADQNDSWLVRLLEICLVSVCVTVLSAIFERRTLWCWNLIVAGEWLPGILRRAREWYLEMCYPNSVMFLIVLFYFYFIFIFLCTISCSCYILQVGMGLILRS